MSRSLLSFIILSSVTLVLFFDFLSIVLWHDELTRFQRHVQFLSPARALQVEALLLIGAAVGAALLLAIGLARMVSRTHAERSRSGKA